MKYIVLVLTVLVLNFYTLYHFVFIPKLVSDHEIIMSGTGNQLIMTKSDVGMICAKKDFSELTLQVTGICKLKENFTKVIFTDLGMEGKEDFVSRKWLEQVYNKDALIESGVVYFHLNSELLKYAGNVCKSVNEAYWENICNNKYMINIEDVMPPS